MRFIISVRFGSEITDRFFRYTEYRYTALPMSDSELAQEKLYMESHL
jgi:hypothetical protein